MTDTKEELAALLEKGGVYRELKGKTPREVLSSLIAALPAIPSVPAENLLEAMMEREALMTTGIGRGLALPHPRNPLVQSEDAQFAAIAFLEHPVDWNSLDGRQVDTLLLIISASAKQHLQTLSKINFFCRQEGFCKLLEKRASKEELLQFIRDAEKNWN